MTGRRKLTAVTVTLLGVVVLLAAGATFRDRIFEQWYIWRLESQDPATRAQASRILGEIGTTRAIPALAQAILRHATARLDDDRVERLEQRRKLGRQIEEFPFHVPRAEANLALEEQQFTQLWRARAGANVEVESWWTEFRTRFASASKSFAALSRVVEREGVRGIVYLGDLLSDEDAGVRLQAALLLEQLAPRAGTLLAELEALRDDPDPLVGLAAEKAVGAVEASLAGP